MQAMDRRPSSLCILCNLIIGGLAERNHNGSCLLQVGDKRHISRKAMERQNDWQVKHDIPILPEPFFQFWGHAVRSIDDAEAIPLLEGKSSASGKKIQDVNLEPPSSEPQALASNRTSFSQWQQDTILEPILAKMEGRFFVESGALDGETDSNTLSLELHKGWTGLLVEPNPKNYPILRSKRRHAWSYNGCLAPNGHEEFLQFDVALAGQEGLAHLRAQDGQIGNFTLVQAQPLEVLLEKLNRSTVDFWSLDIEGSEAAVLNSTNFSRVEIGVLLIEMNKNEENNNRIAEVMEREGFQRIGHTLYIENFQTHKRELLDNIFVNPKYFQKRNLTVPTGNELRTVSLPFPAETEPQSAPAPAQVQPAPAAKVQPAEEKVQPAPAAEVQPAEEKVQPAPAAETPPKEAAATLIEGNVGWPLLVSPLVFSSVLAMQFGM